MLYNQTTKDVYTRARVIVIDNPLPTEGLIPSVRFNEELSTTDGISLGSNGFCSMSFEVGGTFPLVHPETGQSLGEGTHEQLQVLLYSLYLHAAEARDNAPTQTSEAAEPLPLYGDNTPPNEPIPTPEDPAS